MEHTFIAFIYPGVPFLDGNGRLGRLLITLLLSENGMLDEPILYLIFKSLS